jgi:hypothetical protein
MITEDQYEIEMEQLAEQQFLDEQEQQQFEEDMLAAQGSPDMATCSWCSSFGNTTRRTTEGFIIKFGNTVANQILDLPLAPNNTCTDGTVRDVDEVHLCHGCEYIQDWNDYAGVQGLADDQRVKELEARIARLRGMK